MPCRCHHHRYAIASALVTVFTCAAAANEGTNRLFLERVAPLLERRCVSCHSGIHPKGGLSLETAELALSGGDSGPLLAPGDAANSLLLDYVAANPATGDPPAMPKGGPPLTAEDVSTLREWITDGAPWPEGKTLIDRREINRDWWSLRPIAEVKPPPNDAQRADQRWERTPIDAFIAAAHRERGLTPAPEADRRTLIRRLSFDLTGLPPTPDEVDAFLADGADDAYERLVDRLLASPRYGERWGRHWLDVVHYGDTHGFDKDKIRPNAWPYRDYVIRAFNQDMPYAKFVEQQLAGDVLYPDEADGIVALGFIAAGPFDWVGHIEVSEATTDGQICRNLDRDDMVTTAVSTFVSLTAHCARCHNHKFDPITQTDYYRLQAVFSAVDRADRPYDADSEVGRRRRELQSQRAQLAAAPSTEDRPSNDDSDRAAKLAEVDATLAALPAQQLVFAAATEFEPLGQHQPRRGDVRKISVLRRGDVKQPIEAVEAGAISCLTELPSVFAGASEGERRAELAKWISDRRNPLTWRSIVNRVWHYHFGRGLVETPNDFGRMGALPTHPELLDWLARWFRDDGGQSVKSLHRLIVTSAVYRQSSVGGDAGQRTDAGNQFLWRMNRRRLEAEAIRDAALAVSGKLDLAVGGPGYYVFGFEDDHSPRYWYDRHDPDEPSSLRRSVYRFAVRSAPDPFMATLDCADPSVIVERRGETVTALAALALLNNKFMVRQAEHFAARVTAVAASDAGRLDAAFRLAVGRSPSAAEQALLLPLAERHGWPTVCRLLLNANEFVFVD